MRTLVLTALLFLLAPGILNAGHICFYALDANADEKLVFEEFAEAYGPESRELFTAVDTSGDGSLDHEEYEAGMEEEKRPE
jgi:hypothetical protein